MFDSRTSQVYNLILDINNFRATTGYGFERKYHSLMELSLLLCEFTESLLTEQRSLILGARSL